MSLKSKVDQYDFLVGELFRILDTTEETDEGRVYKPIQISSSRESLRVELGLVLTALKATRKDKG